MPKAKSTGEKNKTHIKRGYSQTDDLFMSDVSMYRSIYMYYFTQDNSNFICSALFVLKLPARDTPKNAININMNFCLPKGMPSRTELSG